MTLAGYLNAMRTSPWYAPENGSLAESLARLQRHLVQFPERVRQLTEEELRAKPPGKWSRKEVVGHLIDSGINNLKRFTEAQFGVTPYGLVGYDQDNLVRVNRYGELPTEHLLLLWQALNRQILFVTEAVTETVGSRLVRTGPADSPITLERLIRDYVAHMEHHFNQLFDQQAYTL